VSAQVHEHPGLDLLPHVMPGWNETPYGNPNDRENDKDDGDNKHGENNAVNINSVHGLEFRKHH